MGPSFPLARIMHTGQLLECSPDTPIAEAAARMSQNGVSSILVRDRNGIVGIWTEHDALSVDFDTPDQFQQPIHTAMSTPVLSLPATLAAGEAAIRLRDSGKRHALVVDEDGEPAGIVSQTDLALNQGLEPYLRLREVGAVIPRPPLVVGAATGACRGGGTDACAERRCGGGGLHAGRPRHSDGAGSGGADRPSHHQHPGRRRGQPSPADGA